MDFPSHPCILSLSFSSGCSVGGISKALLLNKHNRRPSRTSVTSTVYITQTYLEAATFPQTSGSFPCQRPAVTRINDFTCFPARPAGWSDLMLCQAELTLTLLLFKLNIFTGSYLCPLLVWAIKKNHVFLVANLMLNAINQCFSKFSASDLQKNKNKKMTMTLKFLLK